MCYSVIESTFTDAPKNRTMPEPMETKWFGRYRILGLLGEGGMAEVHLAEDPVLHRCVALKVLRPGLAVRFDSIHRFRSEASNVARLGNPHIVQVHDMGNQDDREFIVMELQDRGSVESILLRSGGSIDPVCAACVAVQAADGLRAAHEAGVVHRDVKPDNLLASRQGVIKVADFGIARLVNDSSSTLPGTVIGSPSYMSPEQVEGTVLGGASDVFSLASTLFRMIAGEPPVQAENAHGAMWRIASQDAPELRSRMPGVPRRLSDLVQRMHARRPDKRMSMEEAQQSLRKWLAEQGVLDPEAHLRVALGFAPSRETTDSVATEDAKGPTSMVADAIGWVRNRLSRSP